MTQPYYQPQPPYAPAPRAVPSSGVSTAALVLGILGFFTCGLASIGAVVTGHMGLSQTKNGEKTGRPQAVWGLILGYLLVVPWVFFWILVAAGAVAAPFTKAALPSVTPIALPSASAAAATKPAAAVAGSASKPAAAAANADNGWVLVGTPKLSMALGLLTAHARIRNDSDKTSAVVQLTYGADTANPIVLSGAANNVAKGKTVTVDLISGDKVTSIPKGAPEMRVTAAF